MIWNRTRTTNAKQGKCPMQLSKKSLPPFEGGRRVSHIVKQSARDLRRSIGQALDENNEQWEGILLLVIYITPILYPFPFKIRVIFCVRFYLNISLRLYFIKSLQVSSTPLDLISIRLCSVLLFLHYPIVPP